MYMERFDKDYKPTGKTEIEIGNRGHRPPDQLTHELEQRRKAVLAQVIDGKTQADPDEPSK